MSKKNLANVMHAVHEYRAELESVLEGRMVDIERADGSVEVYRILPTEGLQREAEHQLALVNEQFGRWFLGAPRLRHVSQAAEVAA